MDWIIFHYLSIAQDSVEQHDSFDPNSLYKYIEASHSDESVERLVHTNIDIIYSLQEVQDQTLESSRVFKAQIMAQIKMTESFKQCMEIWLH